MTPPTLEEWRAWQACHNRNYTDQPIKKHSYTGTGPDAGTVNTPPVTDLIGEKSST